MVLSLWWYFRSSCQSQVLTVTFNSLIRLNRKLVIPVTVIGPLSVLKTRFEEQHAENLSKGKYIKNNFLFS